jgi:hypothetical protein
MRGGQALRQLKAETDNFFFRQGTGPQACVQRLAGHQLANEIIVAINVFEVVDGLNGWVIQPGEDAKLEAV